jgi:hypothetical protein
MVTIAGDWSKGEQPGPAFRASNLSLNLLGKGLRVAP